MHTFSEPFERSHENFLDILRLLENGLAFDVTESMLRGEYGVGKSNTTSQSLKEGEMSGIEILRSET